jgi:hypothetical protein
MGAWDTGIFDNDSAADFAADLETCTDVPARQDLLMATMGAVLERDIRPDEMTLDFEFGYEVEFALASAAYVADAKNGKHEFTDNAYAKMLVDPDNFQDDAAWDHIALGTPSAALVERAVLTMEKILLLMVERGVEAEWREPSEKVRQALLEKL